MAAAASRRPLGRHQRQGDEHGGDLRAARAVPRLVGDLARAPRDRDAIARAQVVDLAAGAAGRLRKRAAPTNAVTPAHTTSASGCARARRRRAAPGRGRIRAATNNAQSSAGHLTMSCPGQHRDRAARARQRSRRARDRRGRAAARPRCATLRLDDERTQLMSKIRLVVADDARDAADAAEGADGARAGCRARVAVGGRRVRAHERATPRGLSMLIEPLGITTPVAAFNGGMLVHPDLSVIEQRLLLSEIVGPIIEALSAARPRRLALPRRRSVHPHAGRAARRSRAKHGRVPADGRGGLRRHARRYRQDRRRQRGSRGSRTLREADLRHELGAHVSAARSQPYYLDVTNPDANKVRSSSGCRRC